ncbi:MAG TPA: hypothetical protein QGF02_02285 [Candidatus Babeliales bacterium]|nr:hypothetical protein [Candidatus Babeliales bacterium]
MWPFREAKQKSVATLLIYPTEIWVAQWSFHNKQYLIESIAHEQFDSVLLHEGIIYNLTRVHSFLQNIVTCKHIAIALDTEEEIEAPQHFQNSLLALNSSLTLVTVMSMHAAQLASLEVEDPYDSVLLEYADEYKAEFKVSDCLMDKSDTKKYGKYKNEVLISRGLLM